MSHADLTHHDRLKRRAAGFSLAYNVAFTLIKLVAAAMTGSVSLLSEGVHSGTDVVASGMAMLSIRAAAVPPDEEHPYGHGKIESLAGFGESILLILIVCYILFEAVQRLVTGASVQNLEIGLWVMALSSITSLAVGLYVSKIGRETESLALRSNGQHLMVDFWTSVGVLLALGVTRFTGWIYADPIFAIGLAAWIGWGAWRLIRQAFHHLIDSKIDPEEVERIEMILTEEPDLISYHKLRTRHSGTTHYVDVHIVVPNDWSVVRAHSLADRVEKRIAGALPPAVVTIHVDPFEPAKAYASEA